MIRCSKVLAACLLSTFSLLTGCAEDAAPAAANGVGTEETTPAPAASATPPKLPSAVKHADAVTLPNDTADSGVASDPTDPVDVPVADPPATEAPSDARVPVVDPTPVAPAPAPVNVHPAWIADTYANPGSRTTNSGMGAVSLSLSSSGSYSYSACNSCSTSFGSWSVQNDILSFSKGLLDGDTIDLRASLTPNCRIMTVDGHKIWRSSVVDGCPYYHGTMTSNECSIAGSYGNHSDGGTGLYVTTTDEGVTLDVDHFYIHTRSTSQSYYSDYGSYYFSSSTDEPTVGTWSGSSPIPLSGYTFTHDNTCVAAPPQEVGAFN